MRELYQFLPKDYVETPEGLFFAVVAEGTEQGRVLGTLRYRRFDNRLCKLDTQQAQALLASEFQHYRFQSPSRDVEIPGVPATSIINHYLPSAGLRDSASQSVREAANLFASLGNAVGLTGSHLIEAHRPDSDIDLVVYGIDQFNKVRQLVATAVDLGQVGNLSEDQWQATFARRGDMALEYSTYRWHELRKNNKFTLKDVKVDLSCVAEPHPSLRSAGKKIGMRCIETRICDDRYGFAFPAVYGVDHETIRNIVVYSATYVGQAFVGERVQAAGMVERTAAGGERLIVGSARECPSEYLRVFQ